MRAAIIAVLVAVVVGGCLNGSAVTTPSLPAVTTPTVPTVPTVTVPTLTPTPPPANVSTSFDGDAAYQLVVEQVLDAEGNVRHRVPGTPGNDEVANWIDARMTAMNYSVSWHHFNATYGCEQVPMHNVIAERAGTSGRVVVFAAHYDTRPIAEKDANESRRGEPIAGANDGGSGVAVLLELARVAAPGDDTLRFVFFDGEDGGNYMGRECTDWILGSTAYNASLSDEERADIRAFVLVDMVGDTGLRLPWEMFSRNGPGRETQDRIYAVAHGMGITQFENRTGYQITDDHKPFVDAGVPAVDLIHLIPGDPRVFPATHHTHDDDLSHVSAESLAAVGRALEVWWRELSE